MFRVDLTNKLVTPVLATGYTGAISGLTLGNDTANVHTTVNPALNPSPSSLPADTINVAYNQSIGFTGGTGSAVLTVGPISNPIERRLLDWIWV